MSKRKNHKPAFKARVVVSLARWPIAVPANQQIHQKQQ